MMDMKALMARLEAISSMTEDTQPVRMPTGNPVRDAMVALDRWVDDVLTSTTDMEDRGEVLDRISKVATSLIRDRLG